MNSTTIALMIGLLLTDGACVFLSRTVVSLREQQAVLTVRLQDATTQLEREIERGRRVEEATIRLEKAEAERAAGRLQYERELRTSDDPALDTVIPDIWLRPRN